MTTPAPNDSTLIVEADFNAGPRGALRFAGFSGDPAFEDLRHGSRYIARTRDRLFRAAAARGRTFVDIGAHIGGTSLHAAQVFERVIAIEPSSRNIECLRYNVEANKFQHVESLQVAISDRTSQAKFYLYPDANACGHSLSEAVVRPGAPWESVPVRRLDDIHTELTDCGMLHIDAEGHDLRVVEGGRQFIARQSQRPVIALEFAPQMLMRSGHDSDDVREFAEWADLYRYTAFIDAGNNWARMPYPVITSLFEAWANTTAGWLDLYLFPEGMP